MRVLQIPDALEIPKTDYDRWFAEGNSVWRRDKRFPGCIESISGVSVVAEHNEVVEKLRSVLKSALDVFEYELSSDYANPIVLLLKCAIRGD